MTDLKIIIRYDSFVKQLWYNLKIIFGLKTDLSHKTALWNWPQEIYLHVIWFQGLDFIKDIEDMSLAGSVLS